MASLVAHIGLPSGGKRCNGPWGCRCAHWFCPQCSTLPTRARIADILESQFAEIAENQPEVLARHYTEAGSIEKAAGLWGKAGQRGAGRGVWNAAARCTTCAARTIAPRAITVTVGGSQKTGCSRAWASEPKQTTAPIARAEQTSRGQRILLFLSR